MRKNKTGRSRILPLGIKNRTRTELPALVALTALGEPWFDAQHRNDLLAVALVVHEMAPADSVQAICAAELQRLCEGEIGADSKRPIALALAECLPWLQLQANHRVEHAIRAVAARQLALAA